jgi:hypothetical protein
MFEILPTSFASVALWLIFAALVYSVARYAPLWCLPFGHLAVAAILCQIHCAWIEHEMRRPGWDGEPDMDGIFAIGMITLVLFVNMVLLSVTALGVWLKWRHVRMTNHRTKSDLGISFL